MITEYYTPTHVYIGEKAETLAGKIFSEMKTKKVLIHYGSGSAVKSGLLDRVKKDLDEHKILHIELGGVVPNPRVSLVREGIRLSRENNIDAILSIGGGSVIDSSKAIAYGLYDKEMGEVWDFYEGKRVPEGAVPHGVILTLSATGSEMSDSSVITNEDGWLKRGVNTNFGRPTFALLNPELTYTVSPYQTSCGTVDIMMHTLERFFHKGDSLEVTDRIAIALLKTVMDAGVKALKKPNSYEARANLMWAGALSHNGLMNVGYEVRGDWASHQLEHELSGKYDVAHGAGLSALWPAWARYVVKENPRRFALLGEGLFNIQPGADTMKEALETIDKMEAFFKSIDMPTNLRELGINPSEDDIKELAEKASFYNKRKLGSFKVLSTLDMENIYKEAR